MSQLRRRSPDVRTNRNSDSERVKSSIQKISQSSKLATAGTLLFVVFTVILLTGLRWTPTSPDAVSIKDAAVHKYPLDQSNRLSPENHVYRKPTTIHQKWRITSGLRRPDGVLKRVYLINDAFPGPTIECRSGDRLVVEIENGLEDENLSIHWHGLSMKGFNAMDGAIGITNAPIESGRTFTYEFLVESSQSGTFWYHSHHQNQRADGLYGALIVHKPKSMGDRAVDVEHVLMIGDWYHRSGEEALHFYSHPGSFGLEPVPDSIILNGMGEFNCSDAVPARPLDCEKQLSIDRTAALALDASKSNIVRIINVGSYAGISLSGLLLQPFSVDGGNRISGTPSRSLLSLQPGERVDAMVKPDVRLDIKEVVLSVSLENSQFKYPNPSLTSTHQYPIFWTGETSRIDNEVVETFDLQTIKAAKPVASAITPRAHQEIVLYAKTQRLAHLENEPRGFINHTSWKPQSSPPLPLTSVSREGWDENQFVPHITYDSKNPVWVDIILNNLDEESHPFHLHGYDFWVLSTHTSSYNWGSYNPFEDDEPPGGAYNLVDPVKKDTVLVPRRGYAVLRFRADNPGIWFFHCHVLWHQSSGMAMAIEVS